jgi:hypothetical protein
VTEKIHTKNSQHTTITFYIKTKQRLYLTKAQRTAHKVKDLPPPLPPPTTNNSVQHSERTVIILNIK